MDRHQQRNFKIGQVSRQQQFCIIIFSRLGFLWLTRRYMYVHTNYKNLPRIGKLLFFKNRNLIEKFLQISMYFFAFLSKKLTFWPPTSIFWFDGTLNMLCTTMASICSIETWAVVCKGWLFTVWNNLLWLFWKWEVVSKLKPENMIISLRT